jgi:recombination protein RecA
MKKSGAFYTHGETKLGQGRDNVKQYLRENPKLMAELEKSIRSGKVIEEKIDPKEKKTV